MSVHVSVILPTFNRMNSLRAAISSVLTQSVADLELIVVDDASSDDIAGLVAEIGDPRIRYVRRSRNGGAAAARNTGLALATGRYIAFQDSDDLWLPDKLARQLALFAGAPEDIGAVIGSKILYGRDNGLNYGPGKVSFSPPPEGKLGLGEDQLARMLEENRLSVQSSLFRRDKCPDGAWFDTRAKANEDWEFAVRLVQRCRVLEDIEPVLFGYVSADSISTSRRKQTMGVVRILQQNRVVLQRYGRQRSALLRDVGRYLHKTGKPRWGLRFFIASLLADPLSSFSVGRSAIKSLRSAIMGRRGKAMLSQA